MYICFNCEYVSDSTENMDSHCSKVHDIKKSRPRYVTIFVIEKIDTHLCLLPMYGIHNDFAVFFLVKSQLRQNKKLWTPTQFLLCQRSVSKHLQSYCNLQQQINSYRNSRLIKNHLLQPPSTCPQIQWLQEKRLNKLQRLWSIDGLQYMGFQSAFFCIIFI